jgi:small subunit ribosomal protein S20
MPTSLSAKKRVRQSEARRLLNRSVRSELRTRVKKVVEALERKDVAGAKEAFRNMESRLDKAARKGVIHPNTAARNKSRLRKKLSAIEGAASANG